MIGSCLAAALALAPVGEFPLPKTWQGRTLTGLSGVTHVADDTYYAIRDSLGLLYTLEIGVDRTTGAVTNCVVVGETALSGRLDLEGCAWDARGACVWACDEDDGSIRAFNPATGRELSRVAVPKVFDAYRPNFGFESLALRANGLEMWTCNEEALCRRAAVGRPRKDRTPVRADTPDVDDGPRSTRENGSRIRLQWFTRTAPGADWVPAGQWMYETDRVGGAGFAGRSRSGVSDLLCLEDGTLLALEREMSIKKGCLVPSFRCRVYRVDFSGADDVSDVVSLKDCPRRPVAKVKVFGSSTGLAMYEGICLGPRLADGARGVLLVSDGDEGAANRVLALKLTGNGGSE